MEAEQRDDSRTPRLLSQDSRLPELAFRPVKHRLKGSKAPVVVLLRGQKLLGQGEHGNNLGGQVFGTAESF